MGQGWTPLFGAMIISTATGIILDLFVSRYSGFALLAVLISGGCNVRFPFYDI
jgi:solute carrier family 41